MLVNILLIVSGVPLTAAKARPPEFFGTDTVDMRFSAEENWNRGGGSLRMRRCNFAARDQGPVESFKSSLHHRAAYDCASIYRHMYMYWCVRKSERLVKMGYVGKRKQSEYKRKEIHIHTFFATQLCSSVPLVPRGY